MGLAALGDFNKSKLKPNLSINGDGKLKLDYAQLKSLFKKPNILKLDLSNSHHHQKIAQQVQSETETVILKLLKILKKKHPSKILYLSGGVALNVVANENIIKSHLFEKVILNGSVEDNGAAIGAEWLLIHS